MKQNNRRVLLAGLLCLVSLAVMAAVLLAGSRPETPPFTPPPFDPAAMAGTPDVPENLGWGELDAQVYKASVCGYLVPEDGKADVWLTNPETNAVWLKLRILDSQGNILGETGLIKPGEYVQQVSFITVPKADEAVTLKLMAYEPETYYSAGAITLSTVMGG